MTQIVLFKVFTIACYTFFSIFLAICEYHTSKNLPPFLRNIRRVIFSHLRTNQSAAQQMCDPLIQTSGNRKEPSLVSK